MTLYKRIAGLVGLYREDLIKNKVAAFTDELKEIVLDSKRSDKSNKESLKYPAGRINHLKRFHFIRDVQERAKLYEINYEVSGIVITELIAILRNSLKSDVFDDFSRDLFNLCQISGEEGREISKKNLITEKDVIE